MFLAHLIGLGLFFYIYMPHTNKDHFLSFFGSVSLLLVCLILLQSRTFNNRSNKIGESGSLFSSLGESI
jgi:hypothetical protein